MNYRDHEILVLKLVKSGQDSRFKGFIVMFTGRKHVSLYIEILSLLSTLNAKYKIKAI